ncbi:hypothetical protein AX15_002959 [Amanita polypyramis BW_CC]|nr:hypothetical protein AX15_002959 [Amanita polypyramis BW_CC]
MHRHANVLPIVCRAYTNTRHVATAAKLKPRDWSISSDSAPSQQPPTGKWSSRSSKQLREGSQDKGNYGNVKGTASVPRKQFQETIHSSRQGVHQNCDSVQNQEESQGDMFRTPSATPLNKWARLSKITTGQRSTLRAKDLALEERYSSFGDSYGTTTESHSPDNFVHNKRDGRRRADRSTFKERGSLLSALEVQDNNSSAASAGAVASRSQVKVKKRRNQMTTVRKVDVYIPSAVSVGNLARLLNIRLDRLQRQMKRVGMVDEISYDYMLTADYAALLAEEFGRNPVISDEAAFDIHPLPPHLNPTSLPTRPPVVAVMGHVDHGKTTLLDTLRSSSVAKGEAGGITQHIGAFSVPVHGNSDARTSITFLDTPGHAAFSAMRARGARVTDIIVLVVAADDGVMPQTREVIDLVRKVEGKVGVVVAINKIDKPGVQIDNVQKTLLAENLSLEPFGGDIPCVGVSGLTGQGLPELVETISTIAEMQDLRAEREGPVHGYVLESKVQKGLGPVATLLVVRGCLQIGTHIIGGVNQAKVRLMKDASGASIKTAYPGMAVTVSGWKTLPSAGDEVLQGTEAEVKKATVNRQRKAELDALLADVDAINASRRQEKDRRSLGTSSEETKDGNEGVRELRLVIKADVSGSTEAVVGALEGIGNNRAATKIIFSGVGDVSEADVMMAKAVGGTIIGFSVAAPRVVQTLAGRNGVPICTSNVIYTLMDDVKKRVIELLPTSIETTVTGEATVLQLFDIQVKAKQTKKVAGCRVINGVVDKAQHARVVRNGTIIHEGQLDTMRHLKRDVMEVRKGSECGLSFCDFSDLQQGDLIQIYKCIEKPGIL